MTTTKRNIGQVQDELCKAAAKYGNLNFMSNEDSIKALKARQADPEIIRLKAELRSLL